MTTLKMAARETRGEVGGLSYLPQNCGAPFRKEVAGYDLEFHNLQSQR